MEYTPLFDEDVFNLELIVKVVIAFVSFILYIFTIISLNDKYCLVTDSINEMEGRKIYEMSKCSVILVIILMNLKEN